MTVLAPQNRQTNPSDLDAVVHGNTAFALDLYRQLRPVPGNLFFSPYSISTALAMTFAGARGHTATQMAQALHFGLEQEHLHRAFGALEAHFRDIGAKGSLQLRVANALWPHVSCPLLEAFLALVQQAYGARLTAVDYRQPETARAIINTWVEERTENKIRELLPPGVLSELTKLVLANAIYFKGHWAYPFDPDRTSDALFWVTPDEPVEAPMMTQKREFRYTESDGLQILELPYAGEDVSMIVLLPRERDGLAHLENALTLENLDLWTERLWARETLVFLPRFEISFPYRMDAALQSLGMVDAFGHTADFSGMDGTKQLSIGAVVHKAFVAVDEEGTEAAAATAVVMRMKSMPQAPPVFRADHPFLFLIRENRTGSILFLGRVANPV